VCRRNGLDRRRRCGWLPSVEADGGPPVWARKDIALDTCPKSYISGESEALVEEFLVWKRLGGIHLAELSARQVDAFMTLDRVLAEVNHGRQNTRSITE
jgi:hypothetical protein